VAWCHSKCCPYECTGHRFVPVTFPSARKAGKMKVVLSRKGFDTKHGGIPSPIFPDERMISLPIPFRCTPTTFQEVRYSHGGDLHSVGELITTLKKRRRRPGPNDRCHVDPDLRKEALDNRGDGWRQSFGQDGCAQCHLRRHNVGRGDLFLFFGWFQRITLAANDWEYRRDTKPVHTLYGWLQIGDMRAAEDPDLLNDYPWLHDHAHLCDGYAGSVRGHNVVYIASERLGLRGVEAEGAGVFKYDPALVLTAPQSERLDIWDLSQWWGDLKNTAFSHHDGELQGQSGALFNSRGPWQELVVDSNDYPEVLDWTARLIRGHQGE
jgi:hypothetical protein